MPILVMCANPSCGELFDAPDSSAGREVRCPACGTAQTLAAAPGAPAAPGRAAPAPAKAPPAGAPVGKPLFAAPPVARQEVGAGIDFLGIEPESPSSAAPQPAPSLVQAGSSVPTAPAAPPAASPAAPRAGTRAAPARPALAVPKPPASSDLDPDIEILIEPDAKSARGGAAQPPAQAPAPPARDPAGAGFAERGRARLEDLRRGGSAQPSAQDELEDAIWSAAPAGDAQGDAAGPQGAAVGDGVLGHKPSAALVFSLGLVGLGVGLAAGIKLFPEQSLLAAYLGAGLGWMAGFTFGTLLVLGAEQAGGGKVRCPVCRTEYPAETEECGVCGSQTLAPAPDPLAIECLYSGGFALSNPSGMLPALALGVVAQLVASTTLEVARASTRQAEQWMPLLIGLCVLVGYLVFSYWMAYLLSAAHQPAPRANLARQAPKAPRLGSLETITSGFWGLAAAVVYVAPLVTIPLLPVAMLMLSTPGKKQALNPLRSARAVWAHPKGFVVLWMFLMMWVGCAVLAGIVVKLVYDLRLSLPRAEGIAGAMLNITLSAFAGMAFGFVALIFGLAIFRCVGAFGRYSVAAPSSGPA